MSTATLQNSRHNVTARLSENEYGELARYAVQSGMMFDSALQKIIKKGLIQVAIEAAAADKKVKVNHV